MKVFGALALMVWVLLAAPGVRSIIPCDPEGDGGSEESCIIEE